MANKSLRNLPQQWSRNEYDKTIVNCLMLELRLWQVLGIWSTTYFSRGLLHLIVHSYELKTCYVPLLLVNMCKKLKMQGKEMTTWQGLRLYKRQTFSLVSDVH